MSRITREQIERTIQAAGPGSINLNGQDLQGLDLSGLDLTGAHFNQANLDGANLNGATLIDTQFQGAVMTGISIAGATFLDSNPSIPSNNFMFSTNFRDADLRGVDLTGAILCTVHHYPGISFLERVDLRGATLTGAILAGVGGAPFDAYGLDLSGANLSKVSLNGVILCKYLSFSPSSSTTRVCANLQGAIFHGASLSNITAFDIDFSGIDFSDSEWTHSSLSYINFQRANLKGADFSTTYFHDVDFTGAIYNSQTKWPDGFDPMVVGAILDDSMPNH